MFAPGQLAKQMQTATPSAPEPTPEVPNGADLTKALGDQSVPAGAWSVGEAEAVRPESSEEGQLEPVLSKASPSDHMGEWLDPKPAEISKAVPEIQPRDLAPGEMLEEGEIADLETYQKSVEAGTIEPIESPAYADGLEAFLEKGGKLPIGHVSTRKDGSKWRKQSEGKWVQQAGPGAAHGQQSLFDAPAKKPKTMDPPQGSPEAWKRVQEQVAKREPSVSGPKGIMLQGMRDAAEKLAGGGSWEEARQSFDSMLSIRGKMKNTADAWWPNVKQTLQGMVKDAPVAKKSMGDIDMDAIENLKKAYTMPSNGPGKDAKAYATGTKTTRPEDGGSLADAGRPGGAPPSTAQGLPAIGAPSVKDSRMHSSAEEFDTGEALKPGLLPRWKANQPMWKSDGTEHRIDQVRLESDHLRAAEAAEMQKSDDIIVRGIPSQRIEKPEVQLAKGETYRQGNGAAFIYSTAEDIAIDHMVKSQDHQRMPTYGELQTRRVAQTEICKSCDHKKPVVLTSCPTCGEADMSKSLSAAGAGLAPDIFQSNGPRLVPSVEEDLYLPNGITFEE